MIRKLRQHYRIVPFYSRECIRNAYDWLTEEQRLSGDEEKNSIARHWDSGLEFLLFPLLLYENDTKIEQTGRRRERECRNESPQNQLRKVRGKSELDGLRDNSLVTSCFNSRRSNSPPPAKSAGFPSILTDRFESYRLLTIFGQSYIA